MREFSGRGLQITPRCVKCGKLSTADIILFEMQNHLYICNLCRQEDEARGRTIAWVNPATTSAPLLSSSTTTSQPPAGTGMGRPTRTLASGRPTRTLSPSGRLPPNSIFALLEMPLETSLDDLNKAFKQKLSMLMRNPDTKDNALRLREEWHAKLLDRDGFERYRADLLSTASEGSKENALSVGGRSVLTAQEFVDACEASMNGWADGERYLRTGQLRQWILFHLNDRELSIVAGNYQRLGTVSNFRALNTLLYCMVPQRPFRFYHGEQWESIDQVSSATTLQELAQRCDDNWYLAEQHLYAGSMLEWVEIIHQVQSIREYCKQCVFTHANVGLVRGVGLELFLEHILPDLPRPKLEVTFDGTLNTCLIGPWDREIEHQAVVVDVVNTTRGFVSLHMELSRPQRPEGIEWLRLSQAYRPAFHCKPGERAHIQYTLVPRGLSSLARGRKYKRTLELTQTAEPDNPLVYSYPVQLKTMYVFQGLTGKLWLWGVRGNLPGIFWNSLLALLCAFSLVQFVLTPLFAHDLPLWSWSPAEPLSVNSVWQASIVGLADTLQTLGNQFYQITLGLSAVAGFLIGLDKGHKNYYPEESASNFRTLTFWLIIVGIPLQLWHDQGWTVISKAFQHGSPPLILAALSYGLGDLLLGLLLLIILFLVSFARRGAEVFLRSHYEALTRPAGGIY